MNASLLLVVFLQTGVVLLAAIVASFLAHRRPALRLAVGRVALLAALGLVIATPWLGQRQAPVVPVQWTPAPSIYRVAEARPKGPGKPVLVSESASVSSVAPEAAVESSAPLFDLSLLPVIVWALGAALLGGYLGFGYLGLARIRRSATPVVEQGCLSSLAKAAADAGIPAPFLVEGDEITLPFVGGIRRPTIFFPRSLRAELDEETLEAILRHEVAHVANGDLRWNLLHRFACVLLWPQPFLWLLRRPMAAAGEELCDHHVLASGIADVRYANCLLLLRDKLHGRAYPSLAIGAVSRKSLLSRRVEAILDVRRSRSVKVSRPVATFTRLGALGIAGIAALVFARPTVPQSQDDYSSWIKEAYAGTVRIVDASGKPVTGASAWLMLAGDLPEVVYRPLEVSGADIALTTAQIPPRTSGRLIVYIKGHAIGFTSLWPAPKKIGEIKLPKPIAFRGQLKTTEGAPVAGVRVSVESLLRKIDSRGNIEFAALPRDFPSGPSALSDASGKFAIPDLPPGTQLALQVHDDRFAQLRYADRIDIPATGQTSAHTVKLQQAAELSGRALRDGSPMAGIRVRAQGNTDVDNHSSDKGGDAITDADGRYTIRRLPAGSYNLALGLIAPLSDEVASRAHEGVQIEAGQKVADLDFELLPGAAIEGQVLDATGKPVSGAYVGIYGPAHPRSSAWVQSAFTDDKGRYRFRVPAGKQYVYVMDSRYASSETLTVGDNSHTVVNLSLKAAPQAEGSRALPRREGSRQNSGQTESVMSFGKGEPFYGPVTLANGATVRLAYVQDGAMGAHALWKPNGSAADPADVSRSLNLAASGSGERHLFLRVDIDGVSRAETDCIVQVPHPSSRNVWQSYGDIDDNSMDMASFLAASTLQATDMRLGVAAGEPRIMSQGRLGQAPLYAKTSKGGNPILGSSLRSDVSISVVIPPAAEDKDIQLWAYDSRGQKLEAISLETETGVGQRRSYGFAGTASDIARVELRVRDYQWVTFRGIRLYPKTGM